MTRRPLGCNKKEIKLQASVKKNKLFKFNLKDFVRQEVTTGLLLQRLARAARALIDLFPHVK